MYSHLVSSSFLIEIITRSPSFKRNTFRIVWLSIGVNTRKPSLSGTSNGYSNTFAFAIVSQLGPKLFGFPKDLDSFAIPCAGLKLQSRPVFGTFICLVVKPPINEHHYLVFGNLSPVISHKVWILLADFCEVCGETRRANFVILCRHSLVN